jgi:hypothetical protein
MACNIMEEIPAAKRKPGGLGEEEAEIEAVLGSRLFLRAPLLSRMLAYICEQSLRGNADALKEYAIGTMSLGRGDDFDPEHDSIVRVMATRLRKRLAEYYATEGAGHHVKIFLSEVGYTPLFVAEPSADRLAALNAGSSAPAELGARTALARLAPYLAVGALCAALGGLLVGSLLRPAQEGGLAAAGPNVRAIWSEMLKPDQAADVVLADSTFGLLQSLTGKSVSLTDYLSRQYMLLPELAEPDSPRRGELTDIITRRYTSMADVQMAIKVFALARGTRARVSIVFARDYSVTQMQSDNVILAGSANSNPWVATFNNALNFRFEEGSIVRNLAPKAGEQSTYSISQVPEGVSQGYSIAAFLPKNGGGRSVLIAAGTEAQGTLAAADFLTSEDQLQAFRSKLPRKPLVRFPHFEVLLRTNKWSGGFEVVAFRLI